MNNAPFGHSHDGQAPSGFAKWYEENRATLVHVATFSCAAQAYQAGRASVLASSATPRSEAPRTLPTFLEAEGACFEEKASALNRFIYELEPAGHDDEDHFRSLLADLLAEDAATHSERVKELEGALRLLDYTLSGRVDYEHAACLGEDPADPNCKTPARVVRALLSRKP